LVLLLPYHESGGNVDIPMDLSPYIGLDAFYDGWSTSGIN